MGRHRLHGGAAAALVRARRHLRCVAGHADLQPVHLPERARHQLPVLHPLYRLVRLVSAVGQWCGGGILLAEQPVVGECRGALPDRLGGLVRQPVCAQLPAHRAAQPLAQPYSAGAGGLWWGGDGAGAVDQLRRGPAPGHCAGAGVYRDHLRGGHQGLVLRAAHGALFHHRLVGLPARRGGQHPDGAGLPA